MHDSLATKSQGNVRGHGINAGWQPNTDDLALVDARLQLVRQASGPRQYRGISKCLALVPIAGRLDDARVKRPPRRHADEFAMERPATLGTRDRAISSQL